MPDETKTITLPEPRSPEDVFRDPPKFGKVAASIDPCDLCGAVQTEKGAVLWGPPNAQGMCKKTHVCTTCYPRISRKVFDAGSDKERTTLSECREPYQGGDCRCRAVMRATVRTN